MAAALPDPSVSPGVSRRPPVYLAGRGLVSCLGGSLAAALDTLAAGASPVGAATVRVTLGEGSDAESWPYRGIPAEVAPSAPSGNMEAWYERARELVRRAVEQAEKQADAGNLAADRSGPLFVASSSNDVGAVEALALARCPSTDCTDFTRRIAAWLDWQGPVFAVSTACTSAMNALAAARDMLTDGPWDSALVLGVELSNRFTLAGFAAMQLLSPEAARPFGAARDGLVLGEAVAALRLTRHAPPGARWAVAGLAGVVDGSDPAGAVAPAIARAIDTALAEAGRQAADVGLVKVQAAGSPGNDAVEAAVLAERFASLPPLVTLKAALGHTLGASGAAELALLTACLEADVQPPRDWSLDPALRMALADGTTPLAAPPGTVLALILGFGGGHAALVLEDLDGREAAQ